MITNHHSNEVDHFRTLVDLGYTILMSTCHIIGNPHHSGDAKNQQIHFANSSFQMSRLSEAFELMRGTMMDSGDKVLTKTSKLSKCHDLLN